MGLLDDARQSLQEDKDNEAAKLAETKMWEDAGADKRDKIASTLSEEEKALLNEFIAVVPNICWEYKRLKYCAPDGTIRLYTPPYRGTRISPKPYGEQGSINGKVSNGYMSALIFKDGIAFSGLVGRSNDYNPSMVESFVKQRFDKDSLAHWLKTLLKEAEAKEKVEQVVFQGLCRFCGGELSWFGKKCKSCGKQS